MLDTSENGSELQKLIRGALGVNDIIDAFADAATSAENTVDIITTAYLFSSSVQSNSSSHCCSAGIRYFTFAPARI